MKESERTVLGYLAAFTLGMVCMGAMALLMRAKREEHETTTNPTQSPAQNVDSHGVAELRRQTFQRIPRSIAAGPIEPVALQNGQFPANVPAERSESDSPQVTVIPVLQPIPIPPPAGPAIAGASAVGGRLSGKVRFSGPIPAEKKLPLDPTCMAIAQKTHGPLTTRFYVTGKDNGLGDVVVSVTGFSRGAIPQQTNELVEAACNFEPYISAAAVGQKLMVQNRDKSLHSLRFEGKENGDSYRSLRGEAWTVFEMRAPEEFVRLRCEVHPWEFAYVSVFEHPFFAVTDKNGDFVINGIPPGRYTVQAHHRKAGEVSKEVVMEANHNTEVQFVIEIPPTQTVAFQ